MSRLPPSGCSRIPSGMATALYPAYAAIQSIKGKAGLEDAIRVASRYVSFITIPLTLGLLATARPALSLFVGAQYEYGTTVLQIITIFFAFTLMGNAFGNILPLLDQTAASSAVRISSVAVSLVTALLLLPQFGMSGAAVSRGVGMLINFVLTLALAGRRIRLSFDLEALWKSSARASRWRSPSGSPNTSHTTGTCFRPTPCLEESYIWQAFGFSKPFMRLTFTWPNSSSADAITGNQSAIKGPPGRALS